MWGLYDKRYTVRAVTKLAFGGSSSQVLLLCCKNKQSQQLFLTVIAFIVKVRAKGVTCGRLQVVVVFSLLLNGKN